MPMGDSTVLSRDVQSQRVKDGAWPGVGRAMLGKSSMGWAGHSTEVQPRYDTQMPLVAEPINPMERQVIDTPMWLGIRAIDTLISQRAGSACWDFRRLRCR